MERIINIFLVRQKIRKRLIMTLTPMAYPMNTRDFFLVFMAYPLCIIYAYNILRGLRISIDFRRVEPFSEESQPAVIVINVFHCLT